LIKQAEVPEVKSAFTLGFSHFFQDICGTFLLSSLYPHQKLLVIFSKSSQSQAGNLSTLIVWVVMACTTDLTRFFFLAALDMYFSHKFELLFCNLSFLIGACHFSSFFPGLEGQGISHQR
jgi:hypothetical protein